MSEQSIFHEVEEELRSDRMRQFWQRYAPFVIGGAIAIVLLVAGYEGWSWYKQSVAARSSDAFFAALDKVSKGDMADAQAALNEVVASGSGGYPTLARFKQADLLAQDGKTKEAVAAYDALSSTLTDTRLRELALVLAGYLLVDEGDVEAVKARVGGLITPEDPMRNAAREAVGLAQYKAGDLDAALATFKEISADPQVPQQMLLRVALYTGQLAAEGAKSPDTAQNAGDAATAPAAPAAGAAAPAADAAAPAAGAAAPAGN